MDEVDNCLRQIAKVRSVAQQQEVAYVARSRLGRLVLAIARLVAKMSGGTILDRPRRLVVPTTASTQIQVLAELCNRLFDTTKTLVQPSEPLDSRWRAGWSELVNDLDEIEKKLNAIKTEILPTKVN